MMIRISKFPKRFPSALGNGRFKSIQRILSFPIIKTSPKLNFNLSCFKTWSCQLKKISMSVPLVDNLDGDDIPFYVSSSKPDSSWWTGKIPIMGECPGVAPDYRLYSLPQLCLENCTRKDLQDYFDNTWTLTELLMSSLRSEEAFYLPPPHKLRHPMIFYYGHPAALYVNKLRVAGLLTKPVNAYFETIFEVGVDEMSWDDLSNNGMQWPALKEVKNYRRQVYHLVSDLISNLSDEECKTIRMDSPLWALVMGFEHERIHIETSSVLISEMNLKHVRFPLGMPAYHPSASVSVSDEIVSKETSVKEPVAGVHFPVNIFISVDRSVVTLGKPRDYPSFGWDNEYGHRTFEVPSFEASKYKVTNGEFLDFVRAGGYARQEFWSKDGWSWKTYGNVKWPSFWRCKGPQGLHHYDLRVLFDEISMPWNWPVVVNHHEASAFANWKSSVSTDNGDDDDGKSYRIMTELEHNAIRSCSERKDNDKDKDNDKVKKEMEELFSTRARRKLMMDDAVLTASEGRMVKYGVNANLSYSSMSPVDALPSNALGFHDVNGNAWEWCLDHFSALSGFEVHPYYEDFSSPCFDGHHNVIMGCSFISTGNEASRFSRFHFRPHFYQHAGFRLVAVQKKKGSDGMTSSFPLTSDTDAPGPFAGDKYPFRTTTEGEAQRASRRDSLKKSDWLARSFCPVQSITGSDFPSPGTLPQGLHSLIVKHLPTAGLSLANSRVLEVGCGPGGLATLLAPHVLGYWGFDRDAGDIDTARSLSDGNRLSIQLQDEGEFFEQVDIDMFCDVSSKSKGEVDFRCADPICLPAELSGFDIVIVNDVLDSMVAPNALVGRLGGSRGLVKKGGLLVVVSGFQWSEEKTPKSLWLGGFTDPRSGSRVRSVDTLVDKLKDDFRVVDKCSLRALWRTSISDVKGRMYEAVVCLRT